MLIGGLWAGSAPAAAAPPPGTGLGWGSSVFGQIGTGAQPIRTQSPTAVAGSGGTDIVALAGGEDFSIFLKADGTVWAAGRNSAGQLGSGAPDTQAHATPSPVTGLGDVKAIAAGARH